MHDRFAGMSKTFRSWKTSHLVIDALRAGALAWIDGNPTPAVGTLHLPDSPLGQLVHRAYVEQTSLGWNLLFRGFWTISWRTAQECEYSHSPFQRGFTDNGASWAGRAQMWMFDLAWGLRNTNEHSADPETQLWPRPSGLFVVSIALSTPPSHERFPSDTEAYQTQGVQAHQETKKMHNHSIRVLWYKRTPRIYR
jgi:hypothetical protein